MEKPATETHGHQRKGEVLGATSPEGKYGGKIYAEAPSLVAVNVMPRSLVALEVTELGSWLM